MLVCKLLSLNQSGMDTCNLDIERMEVETLDFTGRTFYLDSNCGQQSMISMISLDIGALQYALLNIGLKLELGVVNRRGQVSCQRLAII